MRHLVVCFSSLVSFHSRLLMTHRLVYRVVTAEEIEARACVCVCVCDIQPLGAAPFPAVEDAAQRRATHVMGCDMPE